MPPRKIRRSASRPLLVGFDRPVQILPMNARDSDIANMAVLAAYNISG